MYREFTVNFRARKRTSKVDFWAWVWNWYAETVGYSCQWTGRGCHCRAIIIQMAAVVTAGKLLSVYDQRRLKPGLQPTQRTHREERKKRNQCNSRKKRKLQPIGTELSSF